MGRQLNFWMTVDDELQFVDRLEDEDVLWTPYALPLDESPVPHEIAEWSISDVGQHVSVIRRTQWELLEHKHISEDPLAYDGSKFKPWTMVGCNGSPSFEWETCARTSTAIRRGRIYLQTDWFADGIVYSKPSDVSRWFDRLTGWLRRRGRKTESNRQYVMPSAAAALDNGEIELAF